MNLNPTFENPRVTSNPQNADVKEIKVSIRSGHEVTEYTFQYKAGQGITNDQLLQQIKDTNHVFHQRIASMIDLHKAIQETQNLHSDITGASLLQKSNGKVRLVNPLGSTSPSQILGDKGKKLTEFKDILEQQPPSPSYKTLATKIDAYLKHYRLDGTGTLQLTGAITSPGPSSLAPSTLPPSPSSASTSAPPPPPPPAPSLAPPPPSSTSPKKTSKPLPKAPKPPKPPLKQLSPIPVSSPPPPLPSSPPPSSAPPPTSLSPLAPPSKKPLPLPTKKSTSKPQPIPPNKSTPPSATAQPLSSPPPSSTSSVPSMPPPPSPSPTPSTSVAPAPITLVPPQTASNSNIESVKSIIAQLQKPNLDIKTQHEQVEKLKEIISQLNTLSDEYKEIMSLLNTDSIYASYEILNIDAKKLLKNSGVDISEISASIPYSSQSTSISPTDTLSSSPPAPLDLPPATSSNTIANVQTAINILKQANLDEKTQKEQIDLLCKVLNELTEFDYDFDKVMQQLKGFFEKTKSPLQKELIINTLNRDNLLVLAERFRSDNNIINKLRETSNSSDVDALQNTLRLLGKNPEEKLRDKLFDQLGLRLSIIPPSSPHYNNVVKLLSDFFMKATEDQRARLKQVLDPKLYTRLNPPPPSEPPPPPPTTTSSAPPPPPPPPTTATANSAPTPPPPPPPPMASKPLSKSEPAKSPSSTEAGVTEQSLINQINKMRKSEPGAKPTLEPSNKADDKSLTDQLGNVLDNIIKKSGNSNTDEKKPVNNEPDNGEWD